MFYIIQGNMRTITIKRNKAFTGGAAKVQVYILDKINGNFNIDGNICRQLGVLKNGEEKTFEISEEENVIFAFYNNAYKDVTYDTFKVPANNNNYRVSGKITFSLSNNCPFRFDINRK